MISYCTFFLSISIKTLARFVGAGYWVSVRLWCSMILSDVFRILEFLGGSGNSGVQREKYYQAGVQREKEKGNAGSFITIS